MTVYISELVCEWITKFGTAVSEHTANSYFLFLTVVLLDMPSLSGVSDMDYPLQGPGLLSVPTLPELSAVRRVPLPPELVEQFSRILLSEEVKLSLIVRFPLDMSLLLNSYSTCKPVQWRTWVLT